MLDISSWRKSFYFAKNWGAMAPLAPPVAWALQREMRILVTQIQPRANCAISRVAKIWLSHPVGWMWDMNITEKEVHPNTVNTAV